MDLALRDHPAEAAVDAAAAVIFAAASAFAALKLVGLAAVPAALMTSVPAFLLLRQVQGGAASYILPAFESGVLPESEIGPDELLLTAEMVLDSTDELVLDDVLAELEPDSRVVRLFDPGQLPTAGELKANIDHHLHRAQSGSPDATQALSDALAQLRRSLQ